MKRISLFHKVVFLFFLLSASFPVFAQPVDPFQSNFDGEERTLAPGGVLPLEVGFSIPPNHHLYKDKMGLSLLEGGEGLDLSPLELSPSTRMKDPLTGKDEDVFVGGAVLKTTLHAKANLPEGDRIVKLLLTYQGCSGSLCYRYTKKELMLPLKVASVTTQPISQDSNFFWAMLLAFLGGLGSALTPCVLPIIPITLAFIGIRKEGTGTVRNFVLSLFLVLSMALTYATLGLFAALVGKSLGFLYQNVYFLLFGSALYLFFALSLLGLFEIQLPYGLRNAMAKMGGKGIVGAIVSGFTIGFLAAPCVGPLIASLLLYVAERRDVVKGFSLLFSYGLGMGSLFLVVGTFYHKLASRVHGGPMTVWIKRVFALILLVPAVYYASIAYSHFKKEPLAPVSSAQFWNLDTREAFSKAVAENKPLFVDYFASWCFPCMEMEKGTFSDPGLRRYLKEHFVPLKIDCTQETAQCKEMVEKYSVIGWPTFLILNPKGEVVESLVGKSLTANELKNILEKTKQEEISHGTQTR